MIHSVVMPPGVPGRIDPQYDRRDLRVLRERWRVIVPEVLVITGREEDDLNTDELYDRFRRRFGSIIVLDDGRAVATNKHRLGRALNHVIVQERWPLVRRWARGGSLILGGRLRPE